MDQLKITRIYILLVAGLLAFGLSTITRPVWEPPVEAQVPQRQRDGNITANGQSITVDTFGRAAVGLQLAGTWTGTVTFQGSVNGSTYTSVQCTELIDRSADVSATGNGLWSCPSGGLSKVRATSTAAWTGTANVSLLAAAN